MSDFLNNLARRTEPVRDFRPKVASRFEPTVAETPAPLIDSFDGEQSAPSTPEIPSLSGDSHSRIHQQPQSLAFDAPSLRSTLMPPAPKVEPTNLNHRQSAPSSQWEQPNRGDEASTRPSGNEAHHEHSSAAAQSRTDVNDLQSQLNTLANRLAGFTVPTVAATEPRSVSADSSSKPGPASSVKKEVPQLVPSHEVPRTQRTSPVVKVEQAERTGRVAAPVPESKFAPRVQVPAIAPPEQTNSQRSQASQPAPTINITIGRVEVKATQKPSASSQPAKERPSGVMSLDEYIARRRSGGIS